MTTMQIARSFRHELAEGFARFRADLADIRARQQVYTRTYNELSAMNDRELRDIGISRLEIGDVAREAAEQRG